MKILYHLPSIYTISAGRTIYHGYKNAFEDLGHSFSTFTVGDNLKEMLDKLQPDLFMASLTHYSLGQLDLGLLKSHKLRGMKIALYTPMRTSPLSMTRINESSSLKDDTKLLNIINSNIGDIYYNPFEQGDGRMEGFREGTGYKYHTIALAVDKTLCEQAVFNQKFVSDIAYIGTNLPDKRKFFQDQVYPLKKNFDLKLYGQDWTTWDTMLGRVQKGGQYFNIPYLRSIRKAKLQLTDEYDIYKTSKICINVHEKYQKDFGGDCNERTFKILACGGFEITDDVACIRKYLKDGEEIVIAKDKKDRFAKINYYMNRPEEREKIAQAGKAKVMEHHTYHNRVKQLLDIYHKI